MDNVTANEQQQQQQINAGIQQGNQFGNLANQQSDLFKQYQQTAQGAQGKVANYADYLQGAGSGSNVYGQQLQAAQTAAGYDPTQMQQSINTQAGLQGQLTAANQAFSTPGGVNYAGLTAPAAAAYAGSIMQPLQQGLSAYNSKIANLNQQYQNVLSGAQTGTGAQLKTQEDVQAQLQNAYQDANTQANTSLNAMNDYANLYETQGTLTMQQQQGLFKARNDYQAALASQAAAQASLAAAEYSRQQAAQIKQGLDAANPNNPTNKISNVFDTATNKVQNLFNTITSIPGLGFGPKPTYQSDMNDLMSQIVDKQQAAKQGQ